MASKYKWELAYIERLTIVEALELFSEWQSTTAHTAEIMAASIFSMIDKDHGEELRQAFYGKDPVSSKSGEKWWESDEDAQKVMEKQRERLAKK